MRWPWQTRRRDPIREPRSYQEMMDLLERQRIFGVDQSQWADAEGRVYANVCNCGRYRRDRPPATYKCACDRYLWGADMTRKRMCVECSRKILEGRSSYATYWACENCRNPEPSKVGQEKP